MQEDIQKEQDWARDVQPRDRARCQNKDESAAHVLSQQSDSSPRQLLIMLLSGLLSVGTRDSTESKREAESINRGRQQTRTEQHQRKTVTATNDEEETERTASSGAYRLTLQLLAVIYVREEERAEMQAGLPELGHAALCVQDRTLVEEQAELLTTRTTHSVRVGLGLRVKLNAIRTRKDGAWNE